MTSPDPSDSSVAQAVFGDRFPLAERYVGLLASDGVAHGHIGPREVPRLWARHLTNCALVTDLLPQQAAVVDVGSGAGLPGIPMAIRRPDLRLTLVEPMQKRVDFLRVVVESLDLSDEVAVVRGRTENRAVRTAVPASDWVVARAVAPLDRLVEWCLPLLGPQGRLLAMKGRSVEDEVERTRARVRSLGARVEATTEIAGPNGDEPTWVLTIARTDTSDEARGARRSPSRRRGAR